MDQTDPSNSIPTSNLPTPRQVAVILADRGIIVGSTFDFFPGENPLATAEQIADCIQSALIDIALGKSKAEPRNVHDWLGAILQRSDEEIGTCNEE